MKTKKCELIEKAIVKALGFTPPELKIDDNKKYITLSTGDFADKTGFPIFEELELKMTDTQKQRISELAAQSAGWTDFKARVFHLDQLAIFGNLTVLQLMNACSFVWAKREERSATCCHS